MNEPKSERELFEAWLETRDYACQGEWNAWQAGRAALRAVVAPLEVSRVPVAWKITRETKVYGVDLRESFGEFYAGTQKTADEYLAKGWTVTPLYAIGPICNYCRGEGRREEGDPEIGSAVMDCAQCNGAGIIKPDAALSAHPRFHMTYCSQCGTELGPGDEGVSHCSDHTYPFGWLFEGPDLCQFSKAKDFIKPVLDLHLRMAKDNPGIYKMMPLYAAAPASPTTATSAKVVTPSGEAKGQDESEMRACKHCGETETWVGVCDGMGDLCGDRAAREAWNLNEQGSVSAIPAIGGARDDVYRGVRLDIDPAESLHLRKNGLHIEGER